MKCETEPVMEDSMKDKDYNEKVYKLAIEYLKNVTPDGVDLEKYFMPSESFDSLNDVLYQFAHSVQNYQRMPNVIKFKERKDEILKIVDGFDPICVSEMDVEELYHTFRRSFNVTGEDSPWNSWYKWTVSIVDSARFLSEFSDAEDFRRFVSMFDYNVHSRMALPLLISQKIKGIGFALACDLLKELGFTNYPKPDVHLIDVFSALGLSSNDPGENFEAIVKMAEYCNETPYKVDKIFWLICSGRYYLENPEKKVKGSKQEFIDWVKENIKM